LTPLNTDSSAFAAKVGLESGYQKASISDERGTRIQSRLDLFYEKGEALAAAIPRNATESRLYNASTSWQRAAEERSNHESVD
jgi:hypothetical protein